MSYQYDSQFFDFVNASAGRSARLFIRTFVELVLDGIPPASVLDVGCGRGVWLAEWARSGVAGIQGTDGDYIDTATLAIPSGRFRAVDVSRPFDLGQRFDLVECLEVAEHIPPEFSDALIDNLVRHGDLILFSAATPGQGGEFHVNERPYDYWREKFTVRGYNAYDAIRTGVSALRDVEPWYRYNSFIFANPAGANRLSSRSKETLLSEGRPAANIAPLAWRVRCFAISMLPAATASRLARLKHRLSNLVRSSTAP